MSKNDIKSKILGLIQRGRTVLEACHKVKISRQCFYDWMQEDSDFADKIEIAKNKIFRRSKEIIFEAIDGGDLSLAKWYLEKKMKSENENNEEKSFDLGKILDEVMEEDR